MDDVKKQIALELLKVVTGNEMQDSIEIGTPGKGGTIKVYGNYADKEAFKNKILNAFEMREFANEKLNGE